MNEEERKAKVLSLALAEGLRYGASGFFIVGGTVVLASIFSKKFAKFTSMSAKVSLPLMTGLALFSFNYEVTSHNANRNPTKWGITSD